MNKNSGNKQEFCALTQYKKKQLIFIKTCSLKLIYIRTLNHLELMVNATIIYHTLVLSLR